MRVTILTRNDADTIRRLFQLESYLHRRGVKFDTGANILTGERDWELDWSFDAPSTINRGDLIKRLRKNKFHFKVETREPEDV